MQVRGLDGLAQEVHVAVDFRLVQARAAEVRLGAFAGRDTPLLPGVVTFVSGDRVSNAAGDDSFFVATIEIDGAALARHRDVRLHPGMPAEVYVKTPERSVAAYLARPLHDFSRRAMREP